MKGMNVVIAVALVAVCLLGWMMTVSTGISEEGQYQSYVKQGDQWVTEGLYQRAIAVYQNALMEKPSEDLYTKIIDAYTARYEEEPEQTKDDYISFLQSAVAACPQREDFVKLLAQMYFLDENYTGAYTCLRTAVENGLHSEELLQMLRRARYAFSERTATYLDIKPSNGREYTVKRDGKWGTYNINDGNVMQFRYEFVSKSNATGDVVVTKESDSRLISGEGVVLGIFTFEVTEAGIFSEGFVPVKKGATFKYYDEFAKPLFGDFEQAGTFQNGKAAVMKGGQWMLIDNKGQPASDSFDEIVLDIGGCYMSNGLMLAAKKAGAYQIYNEKLEPVASLDCTDVDILTTDGLIAVCKGGKWGFVNTEGKMVIEPKYEQAKSFSNGLAAVAQDGVWGFIDKQGNLVIAHQFTEAEYFDAQGICAVRVDVPEEEPILEDEADTQQETVPTAPEDLEEQQETVPMEPVEEWKLIVLKNGITED